MDPIYNKWPICGPGSIPSDSIDFQQIPPLSFGQAALVPLREQGLASFPVGTSKKRFGSCPMRVWLSIFKSRNLR